jgi:hypothetical protein
LYLIRLNKDVSTNIENLPCMSLFDKKSTADDKRNTIKNMFASGMEEERQEALNDRYTRLEDHYESKQLHFGSWDLCAGLPDYRQQRIDAIIFNEECVIGPRKEAGKIKVFKANPRKNWQVLDNSFDSHNRMLAQSQVKDERHVAIGLPDSEDASLSQQRRRQLVEDSEDEGDHYLALPVRTKFID